MSETIKEKNILIIAIQQDVIDLNKSIFDENFIDNSTFVEKNARFCSVVSNVFKTEANIHVIKSNTIHETLEPYLNNEADIIIIIGDITSSIKQCIDDAIQAISINREQLFTKLAKLITKIETDLEEITHYRTTCGIRKTTLFVNLSGPYEDKEACFVAISHMLENMIYLIRKSENKQFSSEITRSIHNDVLEQNVSNDANCNCHIELFATISFQDARSKLSEIALNNSIRYMEGRGKCVFEPVKISEAYGRIAGKDVHSNYNVPPFRTSKKHGYAVLVKDGKGLRKVQKRENKFPLPPLRPGTCVWVNTEEPIPEGATAVVSVEDATLKSSSDDENKYIEIMNTPQYGQNIKTVGSDIMKGKIIVQQFTRIGPEEVALLTISGRKKMLVFKQLSIGVLSIGDNLAEPGESLQSGFVYDINRVTLMSLLKHNGYSSIDYGIANNDKSSIQEKIMEALQVVDILVTTGCVNDKDLLKIILMNYFKATIHFGNVNMKPGKSTTFASCKFNGKEKYFLCLSGNPTTALIAAHLFLLPFLDLLNGFLDTEPPSVAVRPEASFRIDHCPRIGWTYINWSNKDKVPRISKERNVYENRLCNMMGSNAFLIVPMKEEDDELSEVDVLGVILVEYPRNFNRIAYAM